MEASPAQLAAILNRSNTSNNPNKSDNATASSAELVAILAKRPKLIRRTDPNNPSVGEGSESAKDQGASTPNNANGSSREELEALGMIFVTVILLICPDQLNNPNIPHNFNKWNKLISFWHEWLQEQSLTALETCLHYPLSLPQIDRVIVGVDCNLQLKQVIEACDVQNKQFIFPNISCDDELLLNPSNWPIS